MTPSPVVRAAEPDDRAWIAATLRTAWQSVHIVADGMVFDAAALPALIGGERSGLLTYALKPDGTAELVTLNALSRGAGIGTALIDALVGILREQGVRVLRLSTSNDNTDGLRFYQRRGFCITEIRRGAMNELRRTLKPEMPLIGDHGIPIRDEIRLERTL